MAEPSFDTPFQAESRARLAGEDRKETRPDRVAVVGYGVMGRNHARVLDNLGVETATVDTDPEAGASYTRIAEAAKLGCDTAVIAVPPKHLCPETLEALRWGMDVLVEKPMALNVTDAELMARKAKEQELELAVGFTEHHNPAVVALKCWLMLVGRVFYVYVRRLGPQSRDGTPIPFDFCTHDIDVVRFLGFEPRVVSACGDDDFVIAQLSLGPSDQTWLTIEASHKLSTKVRTIEVTGERGKLCCDYQSQKLSFVENRGVEHPLAVSREEPLVREWRAFPEGATARDGIAALHLAWDVEEAR